VRKLSGFMPETVRAPSPEALADLKALSRDHGINAELIKSLTTSKEEAREHLGFFKRMMFVSNGGVIFVGLVLVGFGVQRLMGGFSVLGLVGLVVGALLFLKFTVVFAGIVRAIKATEAVARKHDLI